MVDAVERSNDFQRRNAAKKGKVWKDNDEVSNTTYEKMAREAYKEGVIIRLTQVDVHKLKDNALMPESKAVLLP